VGKSDALSQCQILILTAQGVEEAIRKSKSNILRMVTAEYCEQFYKRTVSAKPPESTWPSDVQVPYTDYGDIVVSMSHDTQLVIGLQGIRKLMQKNWATSLWQAEHGKEERQGSGAEKKVNLSGAEKLRAEVNSGKSTVMVTGAGEVERVVSVVALTIQREDGCVLVQLGKKEMGAVKPTCQMPGGKQERAELTGDAMKRLFKRLEPVTGQVQVVRTERQVEFKKSKEYGVQTKYLRTVCTMKLRGNLPSGLHECVSAADYKNKSDGTDASPHIRHSLGPGLRLSPLHGLLDKPVYAVNEAGNARIAFYAWLTPGEFEALNKSTTGESFVASWLKALREADEQFGEVRSVGSVGSEAGEVAEVEVAVEVTAEVPAEVDILSL
jgi:hypothetical protein